MNIRRFKVRFDTLSLDFVIYHEINISQMHLPDADVRWLCRDARTFTGRIKIINDELIIKIMLTNISSKMASGFL